MPPSRRHAHAAAAIILVALLASCRDSTGPRGDPCTTTVGSIAVEQTRNARLTTSSCRTEDGSYADRWRFDLAAETAVQIDLMSEEFDAFLAVLDAGGQPVALDDDGGSGTNARILHVFPAGEYVIYANTFDAGETGNYQLSVQPATNHPCLSVVGTIVVGESVNGSLATGDCELSDGTFADRWRLEVAAATTLQVDLMSTEFNAFLGITDASGNVVAVNDDGGGGTDARVSQTFVPGTYTLWANSDLPATGAYSLSVQTAAGASPSLGAALEELPSWRTPNARKGGAAKTAGAPRRFRE